MRIVLDTNVLISGIFFRPSNPGRIIDAWWKHKIDLIFSQPLFEEAVRVLLEVNKKLNGSRSLIEKFKEAVSEYAIWVKVKPTAKICRDSSDNMVLDTAYQGRAKFIVTGDKDLLILKKYRGIAIITPVEFLRKVKL